MLVFPWLMAAMSETALALTNRDPLMAMNTSSVSQGWSPPGFLPEKAAPHWPSAGWIHSWP
ncbi:MAG: hypothetical protein J5I62_09825 [Flavobacteriales bacterium]|nr:hypothetical protein [Flavobacteriales bacterium]